MIIEAPDESQKHYALVEKCAQAYVRERNKFAVLKLLRAKEKDPELVNQLAAKTTMRANEIYRANKKSYKFFGIALTVIALGGLSLGFFGDFYLITFAPLFFGPYFLIKGFSSYELPNLQG